MSQPPKLPPEDKLDVIIRHLERIDNRDRLRMYGGLVRSILGFIPTLLLLGSLWYVYSKGDELLRKISMESARAAATYTQQSGSDFLKQLQNVIKR